MQKKIVSTFLFMLTVFDNYRILYGVRCYTRKNEEKQEA